MDDPSDEEAGRLLSAIDDLRASIAVLAEDGRITMVNRAWREFALKNGGTSHSVGPGANYLDACRVEDSADGDFAGLAFEGVSAVLEGASSSFAMQYPCHSPTQERWFVMLVSPLSRGRTLVAHVEVGALGARADTPREPESPSDVEETPDAEELRWGEAVMRVMRGVRAPGVA